MITLTVRDLNRAARIADRIAEFQEYLADRCPRQIQLNSNLSIDVPESVATSIIEGEIARCVDLLTAMGITISNAREKNIPNGIWSTMNSETAKAATNGATNG